MGLLHDTVVVRAPCNDACLGRAFVRTRAMGTFKAVPGVGAHSVEASLHTVRQWSSCSVLAQDCRRQIYARPWETSALHMSPAARLTEEMDMPTTLLFLMGQHIQ